MIWLSRMIVVFVAALGGAATSQLPEFAQQYRQRLGGALDEVRAVVSDFDADARGSGLERDQAVGVMRRSPERFMRDRGVSMEAVIARLTALERQHAALEAAPHVWRPVHVLRNPDERVMRGAWQTYEPAVPLTAAGLAWAAAGFLLAALLAAGLGRAGRRMVAGRRRGVTRGEAPAKR